LQFNLTITNDIIVRNWLGRDSSTDRSDRWKSG